MLHCTEISKTLQIIFLLNHKEVKNLTLFASEVATIFEVAIERNMNRRFILSQKTVPGPVQSN